MPSTHHHTPRNYFLQEKFRLLILFFRIFFRKSNLSDSAIVSCIVCKLIRPAILNLGNDREDLRPPHIYQIRRWAELDFAQSILPFPVRCPNCRSRIRNGLNGKPWGGRLRGCPALENKCWWLFQDRSSLRLRWLLAVDPRSYPRRFRICLRLCGIVPGIVKKIILKWFFIF